MRGKDAGGNFLLESAALTKLTQRPSGIACGGLRRFALQKASLYEWDLGAVCAALTRPSMPLRPVSLEDKFDLAKDRVFVTGYQALIRACLMQKERDRRAGLNTAGYVTGYRGSPLGGLDQQFIRHAPHLPPPDLKFQPPL